MSLRSTHLLAVAAVALALTVPASASASSGATSTLSQNVRAVSASDPDDVGNRLDIVHERFQLNGDGTATLSIRTAETWRCSYIQNFAENGELYSAGLLWDFDRGANGTFGDFVGGFECANGRFVFELHDPWGVHPDRTFRASRPTANSASVTIPRTALRARHLALRAVSRFSGTKGDYTAIDQDDITPILKGF
jgi:hypothetical protein